MKIVVKRHVFMTAQGLRETYVIRIDNNLIPKEFTKEQVEIILNKMGVGIDDR
jgi:hypothetical protein